MDGNRDEAEKCIDFAVKFINNGHKDKAIKFLNKAERLYPSKRAQALLESLLHKATGPSNNSSGRKTHHSRPTGDPHTHQNGTKPPQDEGGAGEDEDPKPRMRRSASDPCNAHPEEGSDYTDEQLKEVKRVRKCKDYYEVLGLARDCTEAELKKAYRKLALQFHPDKNKAPGATEAFKAIANSFSVLSDAEKRRRYDMYGNEAERITSRRHRYNDDDGFDFSRGFEGDISPEDLFNMFFGSGFSGASVHLHRNRRMYNQHHHHRGDRNNDTQANGYGFLLQLMPVLILVLLSLFSSLYVADPPYVLSARSQYTVMRKTENLGITYYVKTEFSSKYNRVSQRQIERSVEDDYVTSLQSQCYRERAIKENTLYKARYFADKKLYEYANTLKTPSCVTLDGLYSR